MQQPPADQSDSPFLTAVLSTLFKVPAHCQSSGSSQTLRTCFGARHGAEAWGFLIARSPVQYDTSYAHSTRSFTAHPPQRQTSHCAHEPSSSTGRATLAGCALLLFHRVTDVSVAVCPTLLRPFIARYTARRTTHCTTRCTARYTARYTQLSHEPSHARIESVQPGRSVACDCI